MASDLSSADSTSPVSEPGTPEAATPKTGPRATTRATRNWARFRRFVLPSLTLAIFLVSLIHSFIKTQTVEESLGNQMSRSIWLASQAEIEYLRLMSELHGFDTAGSGVTRDDILARLTDLRNRLEALQSGEEARLMRLWLGEQTVRAVAPLLTSLAALRPRVEDLVPGDTATLAGIRAELQPYGTTMSTLAEGASRSKGVFAPLSKNRGWEAYWEIGWSLAGMLFSGALLVVILIREIHRGDELLRKSHGAEAALLQARNAAEQASTAKSRFLVAANHDMRQPLQSLSLYTAALQSSSCPQEREAICEEMSDAIQAMGAMLDVLLDIENLEDGHVRVEVAEFPVASLFAVIEREFRLPAREKGLDLRVMPSTLMIRSDPVLLERILRNLVANAVSYTHEGRVLVGCRRRGESLWLEVWDSGVGVAEDQLQTIFEDYYQVDNPARDRRQGLGLGLAIVQRVAKLLGHEILVRSELGKGSLFAVEVPRAAGVQPPPASRPTARRARSNVSGRVLVAIEDDATILHGLERLLTAWGAEVFACRSVDEVLIQLSLAARTPDLVIADYRLSGGLNGLHAVDKVRASFDPQLPSIVITGDTSTGVAEAIRASGSRLVHKPLEPQSLRRLIDELLGAAENVAEERAAKDPADRLEQV